MKYMLRFLTPWASLLAATPLMAQSVHISHCLAACPDVSHPGTEVVVHHLYAAAIDQDTGLAQWVAYRVLADSVGIASLLPRYWQEDQLIDRTVDQVALDDSPSLLQPDLSDAQDREYRINESSFSSSDQGRLAPMTSFAGTPYWQELNNLSNMSPLPQPLRQGSWSRLDQAVNEFAADAGELFVVSGPLYSYTGSSSAATTPGSYFKVISDGESVATFVFPRDLPIHANYCDQLASLDQVESLLDRQILPGVTALRRSGMESKLGCQP